MPGPPGIATLEMPRQPHELSKSASTSNTSPCQARWRITRIRASTLIIDPSCLSGQRRPHRCRRRWHRTRDYVGPRRRRWYRHLWGL